MPLENIDLLAPIRLGDLNLTNRIVMAPLTRSRARAGGVPWEINATYYAQRASAGLIISEATNISVQARGYAFTPGIFTKQQIAGWRGVTDAVHEKGGRIFCQLWHVGRVSHPDLQENYATPVAPSAIRPNGLTAFTESGLKPVLTPRALRTGELPGIVADYAHAADCARQAGFDGVEIHSANGYLLDQFLRSKTNARTDAYGGPVENRARLLLEVARAILQVWPADRVGVRFGPKSSFGDIGDADPQTTFGYAVAQMDRLGLAYIHIVEGETQGSRDVPDFDFAALKRAFHGRYIANNSLTPETAADLIRAGRADLACFGRLYLANPDLVERIREGLPIAPVPDRSTWYGAGATGYCDYPDRNGNL